MPDDLEVNLLYISIPEGENLHLDMKPDAMFPATNQQLVPVCMPTRSDIR